MSGKNRVLLDKVKQNLRYLHLKDMAEALDSGLNNAQQHQYGYLQFLDEILESQVLGRQQRSLERRVKKAGIPERMSFDNWDWNFQPGLNVEHLKDLQELGFVRNKQPLLILGKNGSGKTHIAAAIGLKACELGFKVAFYKIQDILSLLYSSQADESTDEILTRLSRLDLLILDHMSYIRTKDEYPILLLDLIRACQDRVSLIVTTDISLEEWGTALGNPSVIHAVLDRLFHRAEILNIRYALSYRSQGPHAPNLSSSE